MGYKKDEIVPLHSGDIAFSILLLIIIRLDRILFCGIGCGVCPPPFASARHGQEVAGKLKSSPCFYQNGSSWIQVEVRHHRVSHPEEIKILRPRDHPTFRFSSKMIGLSTAGRAEPGTAGSTRLIYKPVSRITTMPLGAKPKDPDRKTIRRQLQYASGPRR